MHVLEPKIDMENATHLHVLEKHESHGYHEYVT